MPARQFGASVGLDLRRTGVGRHGRLDHVEVVGDDAGTSGDAGDVEGLGVGNVRSLRVNGEGKALDVVGRVAATDLGADSLLCEPPREVDRCR